MNVSSVSSSISSTVSTSSTTTVAELEKQLQTVQQEIQKENQSKDSSKTKQQVIQELELEAQMIQIEIQQAQAKAAKKSSGHAGSTKPPPRLQTPITPIHRTIWPVRRAVRAGRSTGSHKTAQARTSGQFHPIFPVFCLLRSME